MTSVTATMLALTLLLSATITAKGDDKAAPPPVDCISVVMKMADCVPYISDATVEKPAGQCCVGFKEVLATNPGCICTAFASSKQFGIDVILTKAINLPSACNIPPSSYTSCGLSVPPAGAPGGTPSTPNPPSSGTPVPPPSETDPKSGASSIGVTVYLIIGGLAAAMFTNF